MLALELAVDDLLDVNTWPVEGAQRVEHEGAGAGGLAAAAAAVLFFTMLSVRADHRAITGYVYGQKRPRAALTMTF